MKAPQIIIIVFITMNTTIALVMHGEPRIGNYDFFITVVDNLITIGLLAWGGFFK